ncbi:hypothetical protein B2J93_795 [Marssonina coronariae]|uniref:Uncharacterized protein n=1 Tax=Diplocarpon coronariae TaxID=2795749 RepID=A0A218ZG66_9HELO|nr:hypothetical protein B2J93_795 [Marssonina coronariae]
MNFFLLDEAAFFGEKSARLFPRVPGAAIPTLGLKGLLSNTVANASVAVEDSAKVKEKVLKIANTVAKKIEKQMKWQRSDKHGGKRWTYAAMVPSEVVFMKVFSLKEEIIYCVHYSRRGIPYRELVQPFEAIATNGERDIGQIQDASHEISRRNAHVNVEAEVGLNFETDLNEALEAEPLGENPVRNWKEAANAGSGEYGDCKNSNEY